jgi:hypothetical protein
MTIDDSFIQILAAADLDDADDLALRAALFVTLRELGADHVADIRPDAPISRARYAGRHCRGAASAVARLSRGTRRSRRELVQ